MGMILRIASSRIVGQGDIVGRSGYFSLNLSANSVMRGRLDARRTLKSLVADLRVNTLTYCSNPRTGQMHPSLDSAQGLHWRCRFRLAEWASSLGLLVGVSYSRILPSVPP